MEEAIKQFAPMIKGMYARQGALAKAFYETSGNEALPKISEVMGKAGMESANVSIAQGMARSMKAIGEHYEMMEKMLEVGLEIIDLSDDMIHFKLSQCTYGLEGTDRELCEAMMAEIKTMFSTLLKQEVEMKIPKTVAAGDEYCEVIITKK